VKLPATLLPVIAVLLTLVLVACGSSATKTVVVTTNSSGTETPTTGTFTGSFFGPGTTSTATASTLTNATATTTTISTPTKTIHLAFFRSPSGNIGCEMAFGAVRCDIGQRDWSSPPRPARCHLAYGQGLAFGASGKPGFVCAGDTALDPTGTPLPYGEASVEGHFICVSETTGMTCTNRADGHGFSISRESYRVF